MRNALFFTTLALLLAAFSPAGFGQATDGNLVGAIIDATRPGVPQANVDLTNQATHIKYTTKANNDGQYRFNNIPAGQYDVTASAPGFTTTSIKNVPVELNRTSTANLVLQVGALATTVDVTEATATIDTTTAQVQSTYDSRSIVNLPIIENAQGLFGALNLSLLSAGVSSNGGVGQGTGPSVGCQRPMNNNFMIEGVDNNNKAVTGPLVYVPTDATQEFSILQNQYNSEFGHSTGGQFNTVVMGGTNEMHGSLYEYFQNRKLNAMDQSFKRQGETTKPRYDQNRVGGSVGGPIVKNKWFYFGNFEYAPLGQASTTSSPVRAPTAAGY